MTTLKTMYSETLFDYFTDPARPTWMIKLASKLWYRHSVDFSAVHLRSAEDYRSHYSWITENIPDPKRMVWVDYTIISTAFMAGYNQIGNHRELSGKYRFHRSTDAIQFRLAWS